MEPTARTNIDRVLKHLGLADSVAITFEEEDRVWAWPVDDRFLRHVAEQRWPQDLKVSVDHYHGGWIGFREPGVRPALQVVFHVAPEPAHRPYFFEMDLDESAPQGFVGAILHGWEVARNAVMGRKTDPVRIAAMLDARLGSGAGPSTSE
jgi:hypothetical protein